MPGINLPIIDISNPHDPTVGKAMLDAAAKYGFLYVNSQSTDFAANDVKRAFELVCPAFLGLTDEMADGGVIRTLVEAVLCISCRGEGYLPDY